MPVDTLENVALDTGGECFGDARDVVERGQHDELALRCALDELLYAVHAAVGQAADVNDQHVRAMLARGALRVEQRCPLGHQPKLAGVHDGLDDPLPEERIGINDGNTYLLSHQLPPLSAPQPRLATKPPGPAHPNRAPRRGGPEPALAASPGGLGFGRVASLTAIYAPLERTKR